MPDTGREGLGQGFDQADLSFFVPEEHRPKGNDFITSFGETVAVVDLEQLASEDSAEKASAIKQIGEACANWGFFQIVNHGVPGEVIARMIETQRQFFALPLEEKQRVCRDSTNSRGYYNNELTKQTRDWKEGFDFGVVQHRDLPHDHPNNWCQDGYNRWPASPEDFQKAQWEYFEAMEGLGVRVLEGIALSLGVDVGVFAPFFGQKHTGFMRLNHYPTCPDPTRTLGINRHTDAGALTIVLQDSVSGLQVCKNGEWVGVEPLEGAFVINIGDMIQVWTNGMYKAPLHRVVVNSSKDRYSTPFFFNPAYSADVAPLPQLLEKTGSLAKYGVVNWGHFRARRFDGDYADHGEEIQIDHFRITDDDEAEREH